VTVKCGYTLLAGILILGSFGFSQEVWGFAYVFSGGDEKISPCPVPFVGDEIICDDLQATLIVDLGALVPGLADRVTHPIGYSGAPGVLTVTIGIDPTSVFAAQMVQPVQNNIAVLNGLVPTTPNLVSGGANNIPAGFVDWESVNLHEMGHAIGLAHVNAASESGLVGTDREYTKATNGINNVFNLNAGADVIKGSADDIRGDDDNLHWYRTLNNNPMTIAGTVDSTTYARVLTFLPAGDTFAANADRTVTAALGFPDSEAVMQQGTFSDEAQRTLVHDDAAGIRYAATGIDETVGGGDDYTLNLVFAGLTTAADVVIDFDNAQAVFAATFLTGTVLSGDHLVIATAAIFYNDGANWFFNTAPVVPDVSINDVSLAEGNAGLTAFTFTVTRDDNTDAVSVDFATSDGTATLADNDYQVAGGTLSFTAGGALTQTITVQVVGDITVEPNETFFVDLSNCAGCNITDPLGQGTIQNDDAAQVPTISIDDVSLAEGNVGLTPFTFTVTRDDNTDAISVDFATSDGTATIADNDYQAAGGTLSFTAGGPLTLTITVQVVGDLTGEPNETFFVDLSNCAGCLIIDPLGLGTILNDDVVGGTMIPIDATALLVAGMQINLAWIIPLVLSAVVVGIFVIKRKSD